ncbi:MAG TPA: hypothetical protein VIB48_19395 [Acidimicrobiia bacterium]|jgi:hypothetical protein
MTASTTSIEARRQSERHQAALQWVARQLQWEQVLTGLRAKRDALETRQAA